MWFYHDFYFSKQESLNRNDEELDVVSSQEFNAGLRYVIGVYFRIHECCIPPFFKSTAMIGEKQMLPEEERTFFYGLPSILLEKYIFIQNTYYEGGALSPVFKKVWCEY